MRRPILDTDANTHQADGIKCAWCKKPIEIQKNMKNRIDCETSKGRLRSYHLDCYEEACDYYDKLTKKGS